MNDPDLIDIDHKYSQACFIYWFSLFRLQKYIRYGKFKDIIDTEVVDERKATSMYENFVRAYGPLPKE